MLKGNASILKEIYKERVKLMVQNKEGGPWKAEKGRMQSTERMALDRWGALVTAGKRGIWQLTCVDPGWMLR